MALLPTTRTLQLLGGLLFGAFLAGSHVSAASASAASASADPAFANESLHSANAAAVAKVMPTLAADVVILEGGLEQGIRLGMVCRVMRGTLFIGELIIIESRSDRSAGLILELVEDSTIQAGDIARIKTLQTS